VLKLKPAKVYRERARRFRETARIEPVGPLRDDFFELARQYEELADLIENLGMPADWSG
jgi:hypothetical protein